MRFEERLACALVLGEVGMPAAVVAAAELRPLVPNGSAGARTSSAAAARWSGLRQAGGLAREAVGRPRHGREAAGGARGGRGTETKAQQLYNTYTTLNFLNLYFLSMLAVLLFPSSS